MQSSLLDERRSSASDAARVAAVCDALATADALVAFAVTMIGRCAPGTVAGLPAEMVLTLDARRTGWEARTLVRAATDLRLMPNLSDAFAAGVVSWSQVRGILAAVKRVPAADRAVIDHLIATHAAALSDADPDRLVELVENQAARLREDLTVAREDRTIERSFLAIQTRTDGGSTIYGEADAESTATIIEALDAAAGQPVNRDQAGPSRAQQHFAALLHLCEQSLSGGADMRPRPRVLATIEIDALDGSLAGPMSILHGLAGRPARISPVAADMIWCDATIIPIITRQGRPIAVGDAAVPITGKLRNALIARDGGCRFPGCHAPASWTDAHHIRPGKGRTIDDVILLCRRCHRRIHRYGWQITINAGDTITFHHRGRTYTSIPRHRAPPDP